LEPSYGVQVCEEYRELFEDHLVSKAQNGDATAFDELVRRTWDQCIGLAIHILRDKEDAKDEVQDAYCQARIWHSGHS